MDMSIITNWMLENPKLGIILMAFLVTVFITVISYFLTNRELLRQIKGRQKSIREEMKLYKDNPQKMMELNKKMMEDFPHQMKESMKVTLVTLIPLLIFFKWMRSLFAETSIASTWIFWYIGFSLLFSIILRKIFKLD